MSRPWVTLTFLLTLGAAARDGAAVDPHLDRGLLPAGCSSCHVGHGASRSPMLSKPQVEVCLDCHESQTRTDQQERAGKLAPGARPAQIGAELTLPFTHPMSSNAFSRHDAGAVTCSSCHSPHRQGARGATSVQVGMPRSSPRDPRRLEYELCESCHGAGGAQTQSLSDVSRLFDSTSRSFHPLHTPTEERSPSVRSESRGRQVNCTDCHGSQSRSGARSLHGSTVRSLLLLPLVSLDGSEEGAETYRLCYSCHDRLELLSDRSTFPLHRQHVVDERAACSTCHSAHGSVENRALIRYGEETERSGVAASASANRLSFVSAGPGSGSCWLTCHGVDHAPKAYGGAMRLLPELRPAGIAPPRATPGAFGTKPTPGGAARPQGRESEPPPPR